MTNEAITGRLQPQEDGHIHWLGAWSGAGYPTVWHEGRTRLVHTLLWERTQGTVRHKHVLRRGCDDEVCIAPQHYYQALRIDSMGPQGITQRYHKMPSSQPL